MTRVIAIMACGLGLAACSSWTPSFSPSFSWAPSFDAFKSKPPTANLTIESDPPGAEARTSQGLTCRTPCTLAVPVTDEFSVNYTLNGYAPQSATVRPTTVTTTTNTPDGPLQGVAAALEPNPLFVDLRPAAAPPKPSQPPKKKKRPPAATVAPVTAAPTAATAPATATAPPPQQQLQSPFPPPPSGAFTPAAPGIGR